jgi:hypothetical protein
VHDDDDSSEGGVTDTVNSGKRWPGKFVAALLIIAGVLHGVKPKWLTLDWPTIALILVGAILLFVPLDDIGGVIESLEIGKTKILFRKAQNLHREVTAAVESAELKNLPSGGDSGVFVGRRRTLDSFTSGKEEEAVSDGSEPSALAEDPRALRSSFDGSRLEALLTADKPMALIRIGIEIEGAINNLLERQGAIAPERYLPISRAITALVSSGAITPDVAGALINFQSVRNSIVHASQNVPDAVVTSTIDSGLQLLRYLNEKNGRV